MILFFVIGFCSESVDVREEMRFEVILRMLIRLGLAEWFVANNVTIMKAFFTSIGNLVNLISAGNTITLTIDSTMLANSEFVALLKQANTDSSKMAEVIGVSEAQLRFVTNTSSGMGLIKCGSVVIPFDNQISKDTDLYRLYNTNIHEKIAEKTREEKINDTV